LAVVLTLDRETNGEDGEGAAARLARERDERAKINSSTLKECAKETEGNFCTHIKKLESI